MIDTGVWQMEVVGAPGVRAGTGWVTLNIAVDRPWSLICSVAEAKELRKELDAAIAAADAQGVSGDLDSMFKRTSTAPTEQTFPLCVEPCDDPRCPIHG